jgi:hypothetical protein
MPEQSLNESKQSSNEVVSLSRTPPFSITLRNAAIKCAVFSLILWLQLKAKRTLIIFVLVESREN